MNVRTGEEVWVMITEGRTPGMVLERVTRETKVTLEKVRVTKVAKVEWDHNEETGSGHTFTQVAEVITDKNELLLKDTRCLTRIVDVEFTERVDNNEATDVAVKATMEMT